MQAQQQGIIVTRAAMHARNVHSYCSTVGQRTVLSVGECKEQNSWVNLNVIKAFLLQIKKIYWLLHKNFLLSLRASASALQKEFAAGAADIHCLLVAAMLQASSFCSPVPSSCIFPGSLLLDPQAKHSWVMLPTFLPIMVQIHHSKSENPLVWPNMLAED